MAPGVPRGVVEDGRAVLGGQVKPAECALVAGVERVRSFGVVKCFLAEAGINAIYLIPYDGDRLLKREDGV